MLGLVSFLKRNLLRGTLILFACFIVLLQVKAQTPEIIVTFPDYNSTNISIEPEVQISVAYPFKIDSSCLNPLGYITEPNWDSTYNRYKLSLIDILYSDAYDGNDSTKEVAIFLGSGCKSFLVNDTVFKCIPVNFLRYETEYGLSLDDFRVYNSITGDTLVLDTIISPMFTTTLPMYSVESISSNGYSIRTGDTISVEFNRELQSDSTLIGPILTISTLDTTTINDTTYSFFEEAPSHSWLGPEQKSILILPDTNFTMGKDYFLNIYLNRLTGDSTDQIMSRIWIKQKAMINTMVRSIDSTDSLPIFFCPIINTRTYFLDAHEELVLEVSKYDSNYFFVGWECPDYAYFNGHTETSRTITFAPEQLQDLDITAVFEKIHQDTIKLNNVEGGSFSVYTPGAAINDSVFTLPRIEGAQMLAIANPNSQYVFSHWVSSDSLLNGNTEQYLEIDANTSENQLDSLGNWSDASDYVITLYPSFDYESSPCQGAAICVTVSLEDGSEIFSGTSSDETNQSVIGLIDYVKIDSTELDLEGDGQTASGCQPFYSPSFPILKTVSLKLDDVQADKYEIAYYYDIDNKFNIKKGRKFPDYQNGDTLLGLSADPYGDSTGTQFSELVGLNVPDKCTLNLKVVIYRRRCYLSTEMLMADTSLLPYPNVVNISFSGAHPLSIAPANLGNNKRNPEEWTDYDTTFLQTTYFKKVTWFKIIPYGDTVYLKDQLLLTDRGFEKGTWYGEDGYTNSPIIDSTLILIMKSNVKTLDIGEDDFWLQTITVFSTVFSISKTVTFDISKGYPSIEYNNWSSKFLCANISEPIDTPPYPSLHDQPGLNDTWKHEDEQDYQFKTAKIEFRFSFEVDENSLKDIYMNDDFNELDIFLQDGLYGYDLDPGLGILDYRLPGCGISPIFPRLDGQPLKNYFYDSQTCVKDGKCVTMKLVSPSGFGLPHMSNFAIHVGSNIKSMYGHSLINHGTARLSTEYPTLEVRLLDYVGYDYENSRTISYYKNNVILSTGAVMKDYNYVRNHPEYTFSDIAFTQKRFPNQNYYTQNPPYFPDDNTSDVLNYHLYKDAQWTVILGMFAGSNPFTIDDIQYIADTKSLLSNNYNVSYIASELDGMIGYSYQEINKIFNFDSNIELKFIHAIEGDKERFALSSIFGILAYPGKIEDCARLDHISDNNNLDKYRFLYLWRTYSANDPKPSDITFKMILK